MMRAHRRSQKRQILHSLVQSFAEPLEQRVFLAAQLVADLNAQPVGWTGASNPVSVGNELYFSASTTATGAELWKSDGTANGTALVKDIIPGQTGSSPFALYEVGNVLYFFIVQYNGTTELWKSNGTDAGTTKIAAVPVQQPNGSKVMAAVVFNGLLYFDSGESLWKSDGTTAGTVQVVPHTAHPGSSTPYLGMTVYNGFLYYYAANSSDKYVLFKSDGTTAGTAPFTSMVTIPYDTFTQPSITTSNGLLYFTETDPTYGIQLFRSDGNTFSIVRGSTPNGTNTPAHLTDVNGTLIYYALNSGNTTYSIWRSDGTTAGTFMIANTATPAANDTVPTFFNANGTAYFVIYSSLGSGNLWSSDLTVAGTNAIHSFKAGNPSAMPLGIAYQNKFYFGEDDSVNGAEMWVSDGTTSGTQLLDDIYGGSTGSNPHCFTVANNQLLFFANDPTAGLQLWSSDGTITGTHNASNIPLGTASSSIYMLQSMNGIQFFQAAGQLYRSDGTAAGTFSLNVPYPIKGVVLGSYYYALSLNNALYRTDGTVAGTSLVSSIIPANATQMAVAGNTIMIATTTALYDSDGTTAGTYQLSTSTPLTNIDSLTSFNGAFYFAANDGSHGIEPWKSDGTTAGTALLKDIIPTSGGPPPQAIDYGNSYPSQFVVAGNTLFFSATAGTLATVRNLWRTDGTPAGTFKLRDAVGAMANFNGTLLFSSGSASGNLWRSDGTLAGTIPLPLTDGGVTSIVSMGNVALVTGSKIWITDGNQVTLVKDLNTTSAYAPYALANLNGTAYFPYNDGTHGVELWQSDGTLAGTMITADIYTGSASSSPTEFSVAGNSLFFTATDATHGLELWKVTDSFASVSGGVLTINSPVPGATVAIDPAGAAVTVSSGYHSALIPTAQFTSIVFNGTTGNDTLNINTTNTIPLTFNGNGGSDSMNVGGGAAVSLSPSAIVLDSLTIGINATATILDPSPGAAHGVLVASTLSITSTGQLDLKGNDLIVHTGSAAVLDAITSGMNSTGIYWQGYGIVSSDARVDANHRTTLGGLLNDKGNGTPIYTTFDNQTVGATDTLVKYTYFGDIDLNGKVNGNDYNQIDFGFSHLLHGWVNGDINNDGKIDGSDYTLIDNAFNIQGPTIAAAPSSEVGQPKSVEAMMTSSFGDSDLHKKKFATVRRIVADWN